MLSARMVLLFLLTALVIPIVGCAGGSGFSSLPDPADPYGLSAVDWPQEQDAVHQVMAAVAEDLDGLPPTPGDRPPPWDVVASGDAVDGAGGAAEIYVSVDPVGRGRWQNGTAEVLSSALFLTNERYAADLRSADDLADAVALIGSPDRDPLTAELDALNEAAPDPEQVSWIDQTVTGSVTNETPYSEDEYEYVAIWSAGGWLYLVHAMSPEDRQQGVAAVTRAAGSAS